MANKYLEMKAKHEQEVNNFPMFFAFNQGQFDEGMRKLGLDPSETDKIYKLGSTGGFYRKSDSDNLMEMFMHHQQEQEDAIKADETGEGFIFDMFNYELANHEYGYTMDPESTLDALGMTMEQINANPALLNGWKKAEKRQRNNG